MIQFQQKSDQYLTSNAELALGALEQTDPCRGELEEILNAAEQSADLTRQLLAFAHKQTVSPKALDLNVTIRSMLKMLARLIRACWMTE